MEMKKMKEMKKMNRCLAALSAALLCAGCAGGGPKRPVAAACPEDAGAIPRHAVSGTVPHASADGALSDSLSFSDECSDYVCYFAAGSRSREALENIRRIIFEPPVCNVRLDGCADFAAAEHLQAHALDSLERMEWLDGEPWTGMRDLFLAWARLQFERDYVVFRGRRDPAWLLECGMRDSVVLRCADILMRSGANYVEQVRRLWLESPEGPLARIGELSRPDSLERASYRLSWLLSNHLDRRIHARLGNAGGRVDFGVFRGEFLRLFDSVHVETWEEPLEPEEEESAGLRAPESLQTSPDSGAGGTREEL